MAVNYQLVKQRTAKLKEWLDGYRPNFADILNDDNEVKKLTAIFAVAYHRDPQLMECSDYSVAKCALAAAMTKIYPDGTHAHLVKFGSDLVYIPDWKGLAKYAVGSYHVKAVKARVAREGDKFEPEYGTEEKLIHKPLLDDSKKITHYYATIKYSNDEQDFEIMSPAQVEEIRLQSPGKNSPAWKNHYDEMAKKTVLKRLFKRVPLENQVQEAINIDNMVETTGTVEIPGVAEIIEDEKSETGFSTATKSDKLADKLETKTEPETETPVETPETPPEPPKAESEPTDTTEPKKREPAPINQETQDKLVLLAHEKKDDGLITQGDLDAIIEKLQVGHPDRYYQIEAIDLIKQLNSLKPDPGQAGEPYEPPKVPTSAERKKLHAEAEAKKKRFELESLLHKLTDDMIQQSELLLNVTNGKYDDHELVKMAEIDDVIEKLKAKLGGSAVKDREG